MGAARHPLTPLAGLLLMLAATACSDASPADPPPPTCGADADCAVGSICTDEGLCEEAVCAEIHAPVCGTDGQTYANPCEARAAHVAVAHDGECPQVCGAIQGQPCPEGQFCDLPAGECDARDLTGQCVPRPEVCVQIYQPVCGCDGRTYPNDCERQVVGVQKDHDGECGDPA